MALKVTHKDVGDDLSKTEWVAEDSHVISGAYTDSDAIAAAKGDADIIDVISKEHARQHAITATADHTSGATSGKMLKADASGLPIDATNTDVQVAAAVTASHADPHKIVRKTSDQTVNNSSVFVDDSELKFSVAANEIWEFLFLLKLNTYTGVDWKGTITVPAGAEANIRGSFPLTSIVNWLAAGDTVSTVATADRTNGAAMVAGIYVGGANAGTVQLQWAQVNAFALNTKVLTNSVLIAHKIA